MGTDGGRRRADRLGKTQAGNESDTHPKHTAPTLSSDNEAFRDQEHPRRLPRTEMSRDDGTWKMFFCAYASNI